MGLDICERDTSADYPIHPKIKAYSYLFTDTAMSTLVWIGFDACPCSLKGRICVTDINIALTTQFTGLIADVSIDAMVGNEVSRSEGVGVISKRPVSDAAVIYTTVSPKTVDWIQDNRSGEISRIAWLVPVAADDHQWTGSTLGRFCAILTVDIPCSHIRSSKESHEHA